MGFLRQFRARVSAMGWRAPFLGTVTIAELLLLLGALVPMMGAATALDQGKPAAISYLWWSGTATKPTVFIILSLVGGALGGALHAIASLTSHVAAGDFGRSWTMWYLTNPFVGASLATVFLFVLQAGLGGQTPPTAGGLYGIAAVATMSGLFSRNALNKLKDIFEVAFASKAAVDTGASAPAPIRPEPSPPGDILRRARPGRHSMTPGSGPGLGSPSDAEVLRPEARPLKYAELDEQQQVAMQRVVGLLTAASTTAAQTAPSPGCRSGGSRDPATPAQTGPYLEPNRCSRNILVSGERGTGKTTLMLSLAGCSPRAGRAGLWQEPAAGLAEGCELRRRLVWLETLEWSPSRARSTCSVPSWPGSRMR